MHFVLVTHNLVKGNGQGRVNFELVKYCLSQDIRITVVAQQVDPELIDAGVRWYPGRSPKNRIGLVDVRRFARMADAAVSSLRSTADLIIANGYAITVEHDVNICHFVHGAWMKSPFHISRIRRGPYAWYQWLFTQLNSRWENSSYRAARKVIAVSSKVRGQLMQSGIPARKIQTIINGVSLEEFYPGIEKREPLGLPSDVPLALFVGDIRTPRKNLDTVLAAMSRLPSAHLAVVGDLKNSRYPAMASGLGLANRVHFLGFRRDVSRIMRACDVFVFPSRYEACSLVLLEALASGLPVVTTEAAGGSEIITPACGHILKDPNDSEGLARAVAKSMNGSSALARKAARVIAEEHSWSRMAKDYLRMFESIVASSAPIPCKPLPVCDVGYSPV